MISRRSFLKSGAAFAAQSPNRRPNIFFAISDDQSWLHTGIAGDKVVRTPVFDRVARSGVHFVHDFCCAPSCAPSRAGILTGQDIWRLEEGGNMVSTLPRKFDVYPDLLEQAGYWVGYTGKGWGPGNDTAGGRTRNPAGPMFNTHRIPGQALVRSDIDYDANFRDFLAKRPKGRPFCFWFGSNDPHRQYDAGSGFRSGMRLENVIVPPFLPDVPEVRSDYLDYYFEIERFDRELGEALRLIEEAGELNNTLVVITSDNGISVPRGKANLYDHGTRMPLAVSWPERVKPGRTISDFVSAADLAPTFLEAAGVPVPQAMTGRSLMPLLLSGRSGKIDPARDFVITAMERHTDRRAGGLGYPMRAIRTDKFLYIRNYAPDRWPAGDPPMFGDVNAGPTKTSLVSGQRDSRLKDLWELAFGKRPAEELYDLARDPDQMVNVAGRPEYSSPKARLSSRLEQRLKETNDPRATGGKLLWDTYPYYGPSGSAGEKFEAERLRQLK